MWLLRASCGYRDHEKQEDTSGFEDAIKRWKNLRYFSFCMILLCCLTPHLPAVPYFLSHEEIRT
jgi:hypothetical protein